MLSLWAVFHALFYSDQFIYGKLGSKGINKTFSSARKHWFRLPGCGTTGVRGSSPRCRALLSAVFSPKAICLFTHKHLHVENVI